MLDWNGGARRKAMKTPAQAYNVPYRGTAPRWHLGEDIVKKKTEKKLVLAKETIHNLAGAKLGKVVGGTVISWYAGTCTCPNSIGGYTCEGNDPEDTN